MNIRIVWILLIGMLVFNGCATINPFVKEKKRQEEIIVKIDSLFNDPMFDHAFWGVQIKSAHTGKIWYEKNENRMFMPASNNKIPTSAVALSHFGPDYRFTSTVSMNGEIRDSILYGDLIVFSNGDPTLYERFFFDSRDVFKEWARRLKSMGIREISGRIIGDDDAFDDQRIGNGWSFDYLDVWYAAEINALQFNENYVDITITPPLVPNGELLVEPNVESSYFTIETDVAIGDTGETKIRVDRDYGSNNIRISGYARAGDESVVYSPSVFNPTLFYGTALKETLLHEGISVHGAVVDCDDLEDKSWKGSAFVLIVHQSPPFRDILKGLMKRSQNLYAETMTRLLGYDVYGLGSFLNGRKVVETQLEAWGIDPDSYVYADGSGLSRYNYWSPSQLVTILESMYHSPYWPVWYEIQSVAGLDGTLRNRMKGTPAEGNVHAKTGTIANTRGLSGYVTTRDGELLIFSFLINGHLLRSNETDVITDKVLELLSEIGNRDL
ncbi:MAG: D-alanyl-D-alanine carboxypeptidase/D-alanyl-D-alanine-endopeptidase [Candidatus Marinimicrobia bacterium]|nr:D-alanyl-D-alanine carboxypeptidase/D-alanyl-D-alanine-endopeptidase [Candidatus Neomarinimicrobiota bacterium]